MAYTAWAAVLMIRLTLMMMMISNQSSYLMDKDISVLLVWPLASLSRPHIQIWQNWNAHHLLHSYRWWEELLWLVKIRFGWVNPTPRPDPLLLPNPRLCACRRVRRSNCARLRQTHNRQNKKQHRQKWKFILTLGATLASETPKVAKVHTFFT